MLSLNSSLTFDWNRINRFMCVFKVKNKFNKINKSFFYVIKQNLKTTLSFRVLSFILIYIELKSIKTKIKN